MLALVCCISFLSAAATVDARYVKVPNDDEPQLLKFDPEFGNFLENNLDHAISDAEKALEFVEALAPELYRPRAAISEEEEEYDDEEADADDDVIFEESTTKSAGNFFKGKQFRSIHRRIKPFSSPRGFAFKKFKKKPLRSFAFKHPNNIVYNYDIPAFNKILRSFIFRRPQNNVHKPIPVRKPSNFKAKSKKKSFAFKKLRNFAFKKPRRMNYQMGY